MDNGASKMVGLYLVMKLLLLSISRDDDRCEFRFQDIYKDVCNNDQVTIGSSIGKVGTCLYPN